MKLSREYTGPEGAVSDQSIHYEIRESEDPDGGLILELHVEGQRVATARARADVLGDMQRVLGMSRSDVRADLEAALVTQASHHLAKVEVSPPRADPPGGLRFVSQYKYHGSDGVSTGIVWYDVPTSTTGPDELPAVVLNQMRFEVHSKLTSQNSNARGLVDLLK
jgi:hypothetical protein